ncbi:MAG: AarF/ABC1/UbiB kinase family protein [Eubacterium sp.]|nr:AarF/ABC1/UbiB kinase family protein [Eubacterium sp.]
MKNKNKRSIGDFLAVIRKYDISLDSDPRNIRLALEELGPTFIKLGQLITTQSGIFPAELCDELRKLRDEVAPMTIEEVNQVIFDAYGKPKEEVFSYFDEEAHGSASLSQVHHARLITGEDVAVKIQRIGAPENMKKDLVFLRRVVRKLPFIKNNPYIDISEVLNELEAVTLKELDFTNEAKNLERFNELNSDIEYVKCPEVYPEYARTTVLVMEYIKGIKMNDKEALIAKGYDLNEIGRKYIRSFMKQFVEDGFFQADPHTGNIKISGGKIVWYDMGMMGEFSDHERESLLNGVEGIITGDVMRLYETLTKLCIFRKKYDKEALFKDVDDFVSTIQNSGFENLDINLTFQQFLDIAKRHNAAINPSQTMMSRGIATVQGTVEELFPDVNFFDEVKKFAINYKLEKVRKRSNKDIDAYKRIVKLKKISQIPENIADMVAVYSKGLAPVKIEMGIPEKTQDFVKNLVGMILESIILVALLISSTMFVTSGTGPNFKGVSVLGLVGYALSLLMIIIGAIVKFNKK